MRLNVLSPKRNKEEGSLDRDHWQDWRSIHDQQTPPQNRSRQNDRARGSEEAWEFPRTDRAQAQAGQGITRSTTAKYISYHNHQSTTTLSDELHIRQHVTRDSMVDNLLSTFDQLPEGSITYPSATPLVRNYSHVFTPSDSPQQLIRDPAHQRVASDLTVGSAESISPTERFSPYQLRQTPIRRPESSHVPRVGISKSQSVDMDSNASRPRTRGNDRDGKVRSKSKSKGSNKSVDDNSAKSPSRGTPQRPMENSSETPVRASSENRRRSRTEPSANPGSILDRARPIPSDYHDFSNPKPVSYSSSRQTPFDSPTIRPVMTHDGPLNESFKQQISPRNHAAAMTGSGRVPSTQESSSTPTREPSLQVLTNGWSAGSSAISSPTAVRHQASVESTKSRQGFFRRVFGSSRTNSPHAPAATPQLPPLPMPQFYNDSDPRTSSAASQTSSTVVKSDMPPPPVPMKDPPQIVHKKSSFFRRRKRSESNREMTVDASADSEDPDNVKSPPTPGASSLRQAMQTFLSDDRNVAKDAILSPALTVFYDSHEHQPNGTNPSSPFPDSGRPSGKASIDAGTIRAERDSAAQPHAITSDEGVKAQDQSTITKPNVESPQTPASKTSTSPSNQYTSPRPALMRNASSVAQLTGQLIPDEDESPVDDWVASTPFKRPSPAQPHLRIEPTEGELEAMSRGRASSTPDVDREATVRPGITKSLSAQVIPTVVLDPKATIPDKSLSSEHRALASKLFEENTDPIGQGNVALLLGKQQNNGLRAAYMEMFDFGSVNILAALRDLCGRLALKGETQQVDRIIAAFAERWCACNVNHGFKSTDVVHTICYSLLLLNTDLHVADVESKMTKNQFVKNTISTVSDIVQGDSLLTVSIAEKQLSSNRTDSPAGGTRSPSPALDTRPSIDDRVRARSSIARPDSAFYSLASPSPFQQRPTNPSDLLLSSSFEGTTKEWESQVAAVLKEFYASIRAQRLPLHGASELQIQQHDSSNNLAVNTGFLRRGNSVTSKSGSEAAARSVEGRSAPTSWNNRNRSRPKVYHSSTFGSSTTSFEESPIFSPSASSTWSRSLGRATTAMSTDSLSSAFTRAEYNLNSSAGFASALSSAIIREEEGPTDLETAEDDDAHLSSATLLEDESLGLEGAPWAKEGIVQHKHHLESADKRNRDRNWNQCFAVVEKGRLRLVSFSSKTAGRSQRNKDLQASLVVGGGNWQDNAEELFSFNLRQTLANSLPRPGYSAKRPYVFALMFPTGALHLFQVGTPDIAGEFVSTVNYWAARLSKEPLVGGVSNVEYGWSDAILNSALLPRSDTATSISESSSVRVRSPTTGSSSSTTRMHSPTPSGSISISRPSITGSLRGGSIDISGKAKSGGDKAVLAEWLPPQQSLGRSELKEVKQLEALRRYVSDVEAELKAHNELRNALILAYTPRSSNLNRALSNWGRKSSYLLKEIVKFQTYIDSLVEAQDAKQKIYKDRAERDERAKALLEGFDI